MRQSRRNPNTWRQARRRYCAFTVPFGTIPTVLILNLMLLRRADEASSGPSKSRLTLPLEVRSFMAMAKSRTNVNKAAYEDGKVQLGSNMRELGEGGSVWGTSWFRTLSLPPTNASWQCSNCNAAAGHSVAS